jgi:hypothetical protein
MVLKLLAQGDHTKVLKVSLSDRHAKKTEREGSKKRRSLNQDQTSFTGAVLVWVLLFASSRRTK